MQNAAVGVVIGAVVAVALLVMAAPEQPAHAQSDRSGQAPPGELIPISWNVNGTAFVAILDPQKRVLGVYEVNATSGALSLKSVRQLHWDLQLEEFNTSTPSPREIRALVERR